METAQSGDDFAIILDQRVHTRILTHPVTLLHAIRQYGRRRAWWRWAHGVELLLDSGRCVAGVDEADPGPLSYLTLVRGSPGRQEGRDHCTLSAAFSLSNVRKAVL
jgi:hypothetical protein